jgi:acetyl/propionyl-CoA carboxylase alpha subunit
MSLEISIDEATPRAVAVTRIENDSAIVWIDGRRHRGQLKPLGDAWEMTLDDRTEKIYVAIHRDEVFVHAFGRGWRTEITDPAIRSALEGDADDLAAAPMPGVVITISVTPGEAVITGQSLLVIESMKMQSEIVAWRDGVVDRIQVSVGDNFDRGAGLVALVPLDEAEEAAA